MIIERFYLLLAWVSVIAAMSAALIVFYTGGLNLG